jgi:hypothetical protein
MQWALSNAVLCSGQRRARGAPAPRLLAQSFVRFVEILVFFFYIQRAPPGLVVGSCTSQPGVLGSIPKREEPGKTGRHPVLKYRVPHGSHPPPPPPPPANSFVIGTAVIKTHSFVLGTAVINTTTYTHAYTPLCNRSCSNKHTRSHVCNRFVIGTAVINTRVCI